MERALSTRSLLASPVDPRRRVRIGWPVHLTRVPGENQRPSDPLVELLCQDVQTSPPGSATAAEGGDSVYTVFNQSSGSEYLPSALDHATDSDSMATLDIPLDIFVRLVSHNGVLEASARGENVNDIRHLEPAELVRLARSMGASWPQIGNSLGTTGRRACKQHGLPTVATQPSRWY